jgi:predicted CoA-binding protein
MEKTMLAQKVWAVIGATPNPEKYGYKLYMKLKNAGYRVYAVNPVYTEIDGDRCYPDLSSLPEVPQVLNMVVSPKRGRSYIEEAAGLRVSYAWFQPGSADEELLRFAESLGIEHMQGCVLLSL